jgi:hypothetical protein
MNFNKPINKDASHLLVDIMVLVNIRFNKELFLEKKGEEEIE